MLRPKLRVVAVIAVSVALKVLNHEEPYSNLHPLASNKVHASHDVLLHLHQL